MWPRLVVLALAIGLWRCTPLPLCRSAATPAPKVDVKPTMFSHHTPRPDAITTGGFFTRGIATPAPDATPTAPCRPQAGQ